jgi:magnesium transporter
MTIRLKEQNLREPVSNHIRKDFIVLRRDETVRHAIATLRKHATAGEILYLYVTDDQSRLVGVVPVRALLTAEPTTQISSIMAPSPVSILSTDSVFRACELFTEHHFLALPVVDSENKIIGIVDINLFTDEVVNSARLRQASNVFQLIGVHISLGKSISSWAGFKSRFPWLLCNLSSGLVCAFIASRYEMLISEIAILAMFITVVLAMAESVSIQSMTLTVQVLLSHQVTFRRIIAGIRKELYISTLIGAVSGIVVGSVAFLWKSNLLQGISIAVSILFAIVTACLLGVLLPTLVRALKVDPKIASGPIVLATADIATLLFYFTVANWLLG